MKVTLVETLAAHKTDGKTKKGYAFVHTTLAADGSLAQPEVDVLVIQKWQAEGQSQEVEEIVVTRQNDENLKQNLQNKPKIQR